MNNVHDDAKFFKTGTSSGMFIFTAYDAGTRGLRPEFVGEYNGLDAPCFVAAGCTVKTKEGTVVTEVMVGLLRARSGL